MDQNLDYKSNLKDIFSSLFLKHKIKIIFIIIIVIICSVIFLFFKENERKENIKLSEKYIKAGLLLSNENKEEAITLFEEIISGKNQFYSILALNTILEKNLIEDKKKIIGYFEKIQDQNFSTPQNDLILFKKALFLIKNSNNDTGKKLLQKLIENNSELKILAELIIN